MPTAAVRAKTAQMPLTSRELQTMALSWQCMIEQPKVGFDKLAPLAGYTKSACQAAWIFIKDKLAYIAENPTDNGLNDQNSPAIGTPSKKAKSAVVNSDKATPSKKRKISKTTNSEDDQDEEVDVKDEHDGNGDLDSDA